MNNAPAPDSGDPSERDAPSSTRWWNQSHAFFVVAVLTRNRNRIYRHKKVHKGKIGAGIESWNADDETFAIEEGRRQLDRQFSELHAENVPTGVDTNAARLTHLGTGVMWIAIGAVLGLFGLLISVLSTPPSEPPEQAPSAIAASLPTAGDSPSHHRGG